MKSEPKTVDEMFKMIENVDSVVETQIHFAESGDKVVEVPIRFVLVPIKQFLDIKIEKLYFKLSDKVLKYFNEMLVNVQGIQVSGYIMRKFLNNNTSLSILLNDSQSNLSLVINSLSLPSVTLCLKKDNFWLKNKFESKRNILTNCIGFLHKMREK
jgi:hypothetical protein